LGEGKGKDTFTPKLSFTSIQFPLDKNKILRCGGLCFIDGLKFHVGRLPVLVKKGCGEYILVCESTYGDRNHKPIN